MLLYSLLGFFSRDLLEEAIRRGWHDSLVVKDFDVKPHFGSSNGIGVKVDFTLKNKLTIPVNVLETRFFVDEVATPFNWYGTGPATVSGSESKPYAFHTMAIHKGGEHKYRVEVRDTYKRTYSNEKRA